MGHGRKAVFGDKNSFLTRIWTRIKEALCDRIAGSSNTVSANRADVKPRSWEFARLPSRNEQQASIKAKLPVAAVGP
jgi:hypothetical protein